MKKSLLSLFSLMLVIPAVFILAACGGGAKLVDAAFSAMDVELKSLSEVTGTTQEVTVDGGGDTPAEGMWNARQFVFKNNTIRDAAQEAYEAYLLTEGFTALDEPQLITVFGEVEYEVQFRKIDDTTTAWVSFGTFLDKELFIALIVNPNE